MKAVREEPVCPEGLQYWMSRYVASILNMTLAHLSPAKLIVRTPYSPMRLRFLTIFCYHTKLPSLIITPAKALPISTFEREKVSQTLNFLPRPAYQDSREYKGPRLQGNTDADLPQLTVS